MEHQGLFENKKSRFRTIFLTAMFLFPYAVNGDKKRDYHGEQCHVAQHDIPLLDNGHQAHAGNQLAGQQKAHGENEKFGFVAEFFSFPYRGPAVGEVEREAGCSGNHGQYHDHPVDGGKDSGQILLAD